MPRPVRAHEEKACPHRAVAPMGSWQLPCPNTQALRVHRPRKSHGSVSSQCKGWYTCISPAGFYTAATTAAVAKSQTDAGMFQPRTQQKVPRSHRSTQGVTLVYPTPGAMHLHSLLPLSTRYPPKWSAAMCKGLGYATVHVRVYVQRGWQGPAGTALTPENLPGTTWCEQTISTSPSRGRDWQPPEVVYSPSSYDPGLSQH